MFFIDQNKDRNKKRKWNETGGKVAKPQPRTRRPVRLSARKNCLSLWKLRPHNPPIPMTTDYSEFGWSDAQPAFYHELLCKYIERLLPADGSPILDVGCGNGFTANYLAGKGYDVYGIDASRQGIAIANRTGGGIPAVSSSAT
ncbi:MAG: methyltransferase domain-containing protein [Alistipes finegoldii]|jgi:2-polyprenyl-3-methyl-5-hydroxy-6-metoxy-1,4-benzoquinol methylase|nr:methyltransferase domain-containing protein [Alistipes finegoldii]